MSDETQIPEALLYSREDEWVRRAGDRAVVGITDYAQTQLGDIVYVELPEVGATVEAGEPFGVIESVKAVSDLFAPLSGEVVEVNADLVDQPEVVNEDCYGEGWMIAIRVAEEAQWNALLDAAVYGVYLKERDDG